VNLACGGVARNIAESVARLSPSSPPFLVAAIGSNKASIDPFGVIILENLTSLGIPTEGIVIATDSLVHDKKIGSGVYGALMNSQGDLVYSIADFDVLNSLSINMIQSKIHRLSHRPAIVVVDANLPIPSLLWVARHCETNGIPLWFEPTSTEKSTRCIPALLTSRITYMSPNIVELFAIANALLPFCSASLTTTSRFPEGEREYESLGAQSLSFIPFSSHSDR